MSNNTISNLPYKWKAENKFTKVIIDPPHSKVRRILLFVDNKKELEINGIQFFDSQNLKIL